MAGDLEKDIALELEGSNIDTGFEKDIALEGSNIDIGFETLENEMENGMSKKILYFSIFSFIIILITGLLIYFFIVKCKDEGHSCESNEDCCEDLVCNNNICTKIINNPSTEDTDQNEDLLELPDQLPSIQMPHSSGGTQTNGGTRTQTDGGTMDSSGTRASGDTQTNGGTMSSGDTQTNGGTMSSGDTQTNGGTRSSESTCGEWIDLDTSICPDFYTFNGSNTPGNTEEECCRPMNCEEWNDLDTTICPYNRGNFTYSVTTASNVPSDGDYEGNVVDRLIVKNGMI